MITDEMVEAFGKSFWPVNTRTKIDAQRADIEAALTAALSASHEEVRVTREDAIKFLERACRNWSKVPKLSYDDVDDVVVELSRLLSAIATTEGKDNANS
ncbi:MAG: hypothetical protein QMD99_20425 [Rhizobiaceae bacterium]|nr:hypothetical protein [Rhizobiaceae bacterium]